MILEAIFLLVDGAVESALKNSRFAVGLFDIIRLNSEARLAKINTDVFVQTVTNCTRSTIRDLISNG